MKKTDIFSFIQNFFFSNQSILQIRIPNLLEGVQSHLWNQLYYLV